MHTLINWPANTPYPSGVKLMKALGTEGFQRLYLCLEVVNDETREPQSLLSFVPWTDGESHRPRVCLMLTLTL